MNHLRSILTTLLGSLAFIAGAELNVYPTGSPNMPHNDDFTVKVRTIGGEWHDLFEYKVQVDMDNPQDASMVQFDMDEPVEVMVKKKQRHLLASRHPSAASRHNLRPQGQHRDIPHRRA